MSISPNLKLLAVGLTGIVRLEAREPVARLFKDVLWVGQFADVCHDGDLPVMPLQVRMSLAESAREVILDGLGREAQTISDVLVGASVKHPQNEDGAALWRKSLDSVLEQAGLLVLKGLRFGGSPGRLEDQGVEVTRGD